MKAIFSVLGKDVIVVLLKNYANDGKTMVMRLCKKDENIVREIVCGWLFNGFISEWIQCIDDKNDQIITW